MNIIKYTNTPKEVDRGEIKIDRIIQPMKEVLFRVNKPRSSLVEGDEQPDLPNSETWLEFCLACSAYFFGVNTTAYYLLGSILASSPTAKALRELAQEKRDRNRGLTSSR